MTSPIQPLLIKDLRISSETRQVWRQEIELDLTRKEYDLLCLLEMYPSEVYTRQDLIRELWPQKHDLSEQIINAHMRRLREKLKIPFADLPLLETIRGVGQRLRPPDAATEAQDKIRDNNIEVNVFHHHVNNLMTNRIIVDAVQLHGHGG